MADQFVRARVVRVTGVDLNLFEFDWDLTWVAFFMNSSGKIYGRFGGRDAKGPDSRNSLEGLRYAMEAALAEHRKNPSAKPNTPVRAPLYIEKVPSASGHRGCIHCHQVKEILRAEEIKRGTWHRDKVYTYPLPENVGITLDRFKGNLVKEVIPDSAAAKAGLKPGDMIDTINQLYVRSFADAQYALYKAPAKGQIDIAWQHDGKPVTAKLTLQPEWQRTNITWRPSLMDLLPSITIYGSDLTAKEKKDLGLAEARVAFRQETPIHPAVMKMGVRVNDVIIGIDNRTLHLSMDQFLAFIRQNYLIGETATLNILRDGKRFDLKVTFK